MLFYISQLELSTCIFFPLDMEPEWEKAFKLSLCEGTPSVFSQMVQRYRETMHQQVHLAIHFGHLLTLGFAQSIIGK